MKNFYTELKKRYGKYKEEAKSWHDNRKSEYLVLITEIEEFIENKRNFLEQIDEKKIKEYSRVYNFLTTENYYYSDNFKNIASEKKELEDVFEMLEEAEFILNKINSLNKTIVLVGANGSGKSSLADFLKNNLENKVIIFPAQKFLRINNDNYEITYNKEMVKGNQLSVRAKSTENGYFENQLLRSIRAVVNEYTSSLYEADEKKISRPEKTSFDKLIAIYKQLIPEITLKPDPENRILIPIKNDEKYDFNSMSEGEKVIILYITEILLAKKKSYIIIDEPESHLNLAFINKLWDLLIKEREDCYFIFISHNIEFINSRDSAEFIWCKNYIYPNKWELEFIKDSKEIPRELILKLTGSKKPIIFCEGSPKDLDYQIYSKIFMESHTIFAVGGHREVIGYTKACNKVLNSQVCYGIIDGDLIFEEDEIKKFNEKRIMILAFNEIEMFLIEEKIIKAVIEHFESINEKEIEEKFEKFKEKFIKKIEENIEKIALEKIKKEIDISLKKVNIKEYRTYGDLEKSMSEIFSNFSLNKKFEEYKEKIKKICEEKNYEEMLKWCSLKKEITKELANKELVRDYEKSALTVISKKEKLQKELREKYFKELKGI